MKLSVVIVSYNVKYYLAQCLRSVEKAIGVLECGQQGDASGDTAEIIVLIIILRMERWNISNSVSRLPDILISML